MTFIIELLIILGSLALLCLIVFGVGVVLGIMNRKDDTRFLREAEERSNRKTEDKT
jgi:hypothetical protein